MIRALPSFALTITLIICAGSSAAFAQFGGQPGGMGPGMGPQGGEEPREEGPAEPAPEDETERPGDLAPTGGYQGQERFRTKVIEVDGYLRLRSDFFHQLDLGQGYVVDGEALRKPPFPTPLECGVQASCGEHDVGGANLRLRLEPTINVTDQVRVLVQVDVLDNTLMGSTPDSLVSVSRPGDRTSRAPVSSLYTTQDPPEIGQNGFLSSVRAKRAWGEVDTEFGSLRFGRMPWHFGRGIAFNNGACPDCEGGTTVDRILGLTQVYGHQLALAWDFGAQGYHLGMVDLGRRDPQAPPVDLSQSDDVMQLMAALTLYDDDRRFRERIDAGELAVNYGIQLVYRSQGREVYEITADPATPGGTDSAATDADATLTREDVARGLVNVDARVFVPGIWFKLGWKVLTIELEVESVLGKIENAGPLAAATQPTQKELSLRQLGWVLSSELRLYRNAFFVGFETGGATGDQAEDTTAHLNYRWKFVPQPVGDDTLADFKFNPDYQVDQILFRRLLGTVTNTMYFKPSMTYWLDLAETRQLGLSGAVLYSMALEKVSTPGNSLSYGIELNVGAHYRNPRDGFYGGLTWAVLWPMGALDRGIVGSGGTRTNWLRKEDASAAQVLRLFLGIKL